VAALFLSSRGELSTSQAARLAGMTYGEFLEAGTCALHDLSRCRGRTFVKLNCAAILTGELDQSDESGTMNENCD
jgi:hypothetical protein